MNELDREQFDIVVSRCATAESRLKESVKILDALRDAIDAKFYKDGDGNMRSVDNSRIIGITLMQAIDAFLDGVNQ